MADTKNSNGDATFGSGLLDCIDVLLAAAIEQGTTPARLGSMFAVRLQEQSDAGHVTACIPLRMMVDRCAAYKREIDAMAAELPPPAPTSDARH